MPNKSATDELPISHFNISTNKLLKMIDCKLINDVVKELSKNYTSEKLSTIESLDIVMTDELAKQMDSSRLYGKIIYSTTMDELNDIYNDALKDNKIGLYHKIYYMLAKKRINNL